MASAFDVQAIRKHFPALDKKQIYLDNAGGSQILQSVVDSISTYLTTTNVQLGASYKVGTESTRLYTEGCEAVAKYINAEPSEVVLGPSTTQLFRNLSLALFDHVTPGSEIIVSKLDHEANVAAWLQLAEWRQAKIVWWSGNNHKTNPRLEPETLRPLLNEKTKLVACTQTSNILGTIHDIKGIAEVAHSVPNALLVVDAVAFAPHRAVDVRDWNLDFYCFSWYKVYGPHIASLYASATAQKTMLSLGHYFKGKATLEDKLGLGAASYELVASVPAVCQYLQHVPWTAIAEHEERLQSILLDYIESRRDQLQILGEPTADKEKRVPVISFTVRGRSSRDVAEAIVARSECGCRWGSFYSNRLIEEVLGLDAAEGVVRVSLVHYNTEEEVRGFVKILDGVITESHA